MEKIAIIVAVVSGVAGLLLCVAMLVVWLRQRQRDRSVIPPLYPALLAKQSPPVPAVSDVGLELSGPEAQQLMRMNEQKPTPDEHDDDLREFQLDSHDVQLDGAVHLPVDEGTQDEVPPAEESSQSTDYEKK